MMGILVATAASRPSKWTELGYIDVYQPMYTNTHLCVSLSASSLVDVHHLPLMYKQVSRGTRPTGVFTLKLSAH